MPSRPSPELLATLLDEHGGTLALYASQWTSEPDDCVQEALVELARQRTTPDSPLAWLYRVVKRRALNAARSSQRRSGREQEAFRRRLQVLDGAPDPASIAMLADTVAQLDPAEREVVVLRVWGGLTFAEAGDAVGVATSTAARRYESAIERLRQDWIPTDDPEDQPESIR